jgi:hypothetical protein
VVAGHQVVDRRADLQDLARALMPDDARGERRQRSVHRGEVTVADPRRPDPDPDLVRPRIDRRDIVTHFQFVVADGVQYGRSDWAASSLGRGGPPLARLQVHSATD